jgi:heme/copper-type cytochrome/quinol oxidase subunit 2
MERFYLLTLFAQRLNYEQLPQRAANDDLVQSILSLVFTVTGAISVMMVVIGGIKYASSQGDPQAVSKAKGTIIYAVVGLIVSIFAVTIVSFVVGRVA